MYSFACTYRTRTCAVYCVLDARMSSVTDETDTDGQHATAYTHSANKIVPIADQYRVVKNVTRQHCRVIFILGNLPSTIVDQYSRVLQVLRGLQERGRRSRVRFSIYLHTVIFSGMFDAAFFAIHEFLEYTASNI